MRLSILALWGIFTCSAAGVGSAPAHAQIFETGNDFISRCAKPETNMMIACSAYIRGLSEGTDAGWRLALIGAGNTVTSGVFCYPGGVRYDQLIAVYLKWLGQNPEVRHQPNSILYLRAMMAAYPCPAAGQ